MKSSSFSDMVLLLSKLPSGRGGRSRRNRKPGYPRPQGKRTDYSTRLLDNSWYQTRLD